MDLLSILCDRLDKEFPDIASMNVEVVYQTETGETESYITDTVSLLESNHLDILNMMQKVETSQDATYNVLTRTETRLGKLYHCDAVSKLDGDGYKVLEVQWG